MPPRAPARHSILYLERIKWFCRRAGVDAGAHLGFGVVLGRRRRQRIVLHRPEMLRGAFRSTFGAGCRSRAAMEAHDSLPQTYGNVRDESGSRFLRTPPFSPWRLQSCARRRRCRQPQKIRLRVVGSDRALWAEVVRERRMAAFTDQHGAIRSRAEHNIAPRRRRCGRVAVVLVKAGAGAGDLALYGARQKLSCRRRHRAPMTKCASTSRQGCSGTHAL